MDSQHKEAGPVWGLAQPMFRLDTKVCGDNMPSGSRKTSQGRKAQHYVDALGSCCPLT